MPQPADAVCNLACTTLRDANRAAEFLVDTQLQLARFRVKMAETALENLRELESQLDAAKDWNTLASAQSAYMQRQSNQGASALRQWADLLNSAQQVSLPQATEWNGKYRHPLGTAMSPAQLLMASLNSWQTLVNTFNVIAASASETKKPVTTQTASAGSAPSDRR